MIYCDKSILTCLKKVFEKVTVYVQTKKCVLLFICDSGKNILADIFFTLTPKIKVIVAKKHPYFE